MGGMLGSKGGLPNGGLGGGGGPRMTPKGGGGGLNRGGGLRITGAGGGAGVRKRRDCGCAILQNMIT